MGELELSAGRQRTQPDSILVGLSDFFVDRLRRLYARRRVMVTGAGGFVGGRLSRALIELGADVVEVVLAREPQTSPFARVRTDVRDSAVLRRTISSYQIDTVFHIAGCSLVQASVSDPLNAFGTNAIGTLSVLEAIRQTRPSAVCIVASSDKAYGDRDLPYRENDPLTPRNIYDASKACGDIIARSYAHSYSMDVRVVRSSNVYGEGDESSTRLIPRTIRALLDRRSPIVAVIDNLSWRVKMTLRDFVDKKMTTCVREFVHIDDEARAYLLIADHEMPQTRAVFNVGGTGPMAVSDVIARIGAMFVDWDQTIDVVASVGEIERQYVNAEHLMRTTGWRPLVSLDDGLRRTCNWIKRCA